MDKTITSVLKVSTYIITSITTRPIVLAVILAIMSVSTFKTDVILYLMKTLMLNMEIAGINFLVDPKQI
jgi:hypothetical protein